MAPAMDLARTPGWRLPIRIGEWWTRGRPRTRRAIVAVACVLAACVVLRLAAPYVIRSLINRALVKPGPYQGHVDDVSLALWRGRYALAGFHLTAQEPGGARLPLLDVERIGVGLRWRPLLHGHVVGGVDIDHPHLHLVPQPGDRTPAPPPSPAPERKPGEAGGDTTPATPPAQRWQDKVADLASIRIDEVIINGGDVEYRDTVRGFSARLGGIDGAILGLALGAGEGSKASFRFSGDTAGGGRLMVEGTVEPLSRLPKFDLRASLEGLDLPALNPISRNFEHLVFAAGTFSGYLELATERDRLSGSFKPIFHDLDIDSFRDKSGGTATKLFWKAVVPVAEYLLENDDKSQHAARIPIKGTLEDPRTDAWTAIVTALRNAFIKALLPGFGKD